MGVKQVVLNLGLASQFNGIDIPSKMRSLRRTASGMPIPRFASWKNDVPDFAVMDANYLRSAVSNKLCWICGNKLGRFAAFVGGPKSAASGHYTEPPCHRECAEFAVQVCPYIVTGKDIRRNSLSQEDAQSLYRNEGDPKNPEIFGIVISDRWSFKPTRMLFILEDVVEILWRKGGRPATEEDISIAQALSYEAVLEVARRRAIDPEDIHSFVPRPTQPISIRMTST